MPILRNTTKHHNYNCVNKKRTLPPPTISLCSVQSIEILFTYTVSQLSLSATSLCAGRGRLKEVVTYERVFEAVFD